MTPPRPRGGPACHGAKNRWGSRSPEAREGAGALRDRGFRGRARGWASMASRARWLHEEARAVRAETSSRVGRLGERLKGEALEGGQFEDLTRLGGWFRRDVAPSKRTRRDRTLHNAPFEARSSQRDRPATRFKAPPCRPGAPASRCQATHVPIRTSRKLASKAERPAQRVLEGPPTQPRSDAEFPQPASKRPRPDPEHLGENSSRPTARSAPPGIRVRAPVLLQPRTLLQRDPIPIRP